MSDCGYILLNRAALGHVMFRRDQHSEFEAWVWLLSEAAWKPWQRRLGEHVVDLQRGQLAASIRHLMKEWSWSQHKVERFLNRLKDEQMLATDAATGITIITICNYDKYQAGGEAPATPAATGSATGSATDPATKENTLNTLKQDRGASAPDAEKKSRKKPVRGMPDIFPMSEAQKSYADKHGYKFEVGPSFAYNKVRPGPAQDMFTAFKNHHAAKGSMFADWDAAWRTWVDNQVKWDTQRGKPPGLRPAI